MAVINILIGPPCSGKTTLAKRLLRENSYMVRVNRDELRKMMLGKIYTNNGYAEQSINEITKMLIERCVLAEVDLIIDATHCKPSYITQIKNMCPHGHSTQFKYLICDVPFWKQRWRNFWRWVKTGDWIPKEVSINMDKNFRQTLKLIKADKV